MFDVRFEFSFCDFECIIQIFTTLSVFVYVFEITLGSVCFRNSSPFRDSPKLGMIANVNQMLKIETETLIGSCSARVDRLFRVQGGEGRLNLAWRSLIVYLFVWVLNTHLTTVKTY